MRFTIAVLGYLSGTVGALPDANDYVSTGTCNFSEGHTFQTPGCNFDTVSAATGCSAAELQAILGGDEDTIKYKTIPGLCAKAITGIAEQLSLETSASDQYEHFVKGCVNNNNIQLYKDQSVEECATLCNAREDCYGFEYGVAYGGKGAYKARDCQLQSSADTSNCDGAHHNLDFYKKMSAIDIYVNEYGGDKRFKFEDVMAKGYIWDQNFFNGGTAYNSIEDDSIIDEQAIRIQAVADEISGSKIIGFPHYLPNFEYCDLNAVMCCYIAKKEDNATNGEPADTTDICYHDMSKSQRASRTQRGIASFLGDSEGNAHCEAFAWDDKTGPYKGNTLFHVAMEKNWMQNQYTRAVPGAPMCACIEQMPVVSSAACTDTGVVQDLEITTSSDGSLCLKLTKSEITFSDCGGDDFATHDTSVSDHVVGSCPDTPPQLADQGYQPRDAAWTPIYGKGDLYYPAMDTNKVRDLVNDGLKPIKRTCLDCLNSHYNIYYQRLTPIPDDLDIMDILLLNWFDDTGNEFNKDFKLYSTLLDAQEDKNAWTYCNFMYAKIGFPRDCGPDRKIDGQWTSLIHGGRQHVGFAVGG